MVYLPHSVDVRKPSKAKGVAYNQAVPLACQLTPAKMGTVAFDPGGVQIAEPHMLMWDVSLPDSCPVGSVFDFKNDWYKVQTPTQVFDAHPTAASCSCYCEKLQFVPEGLDVLDDIYHGSGRGGGAGGRVPQLIEPTPGP